jgi:hypothetical protein
MVLNPAGSGLIYSTILPGATTDSNRSVLGRRRPGIAVDSAGNAYLTGSAGTGFPTTPGAFQTAALGQTTAYLAKMNPNLSGTASLVYSTYLSGSGGDYGTAVAVDGSGNAYAAGMTGSADFPATGEGTGTFTFTGGTGRFAHATGHGTFDAFIDLSLPNDQPMIVTLDGKIQY